MDPGDPPPPVGNSQKSKTTENGLGGSILTRKVGEKCFYLILRRPGPIIELKVHFWGVNQPPIRPQRSRGVGNQRSDPTENGLGGSILTHKVSVKCSNLILRRSGLILKSKVQFWR